MPKHRILLQTNPTWLKTGLAEGAKTLLKYLWQTDRYDVAHLCTQGTSMVDPRLNLTPWKSFGCIPPDQALINQLNSDPNLQRNASYGSYGIDQIIKDWKPTIWIGSDDLWAFQINDYMDKAWYKQINCVPHITIDSVPVLDLAFEQAKRSKYYLTWAKFAAKEMKRVQPGIETNHINSIYGAMDTQLFSPITEAEKASIRKQFGIAPDSFLFVFVFRNQLRKQSNRVIDGFARFKKENPNTKAQLYFHTSFSEKGAGFDIPKTMAYYGLKTEDVLCTYTCKACSRWWIRPYGGEDIDCPHCGVQKSGITINIQNGVAPYEMRYIYGVADACIQAHSSGGQELNACQGLLCGKPLCITNYSCGEDFCTPDTESFIFPLGFQFYDEMGTNFLKASTSPKDIAAFMRKVARAPRRELQEVGEKSRVWAARTFGIEAIGAQWERLFASMPMPDWSTITLVSGGVAKDESYPMPTGIDSDLEWVKLLYNHILKMDVTDQDSGVEHWLSKLKGGLKRDEIYRYFISVAQQENAKNKPPQDFGAMLDKTTGRKRALFLIKESIGDCLICSQLFESFHEKYRDHDLYVMTDPKYNEVFLGNPYVFKLLPYVSAAENELIMTGAGQKEVYFHVYFHPGILTQRNLFYLTTKNV